MALEPLDRLTNRLLMLYIIEKASRRGFLTGKVKLLKLLYAAEEELSKARARGLTYEFHRWQYGPFSYEALSDFEWLLQNDLANYSQEPSEIGFTARCVEVLKECAPLLRENQEILCFIDRVVERFLLDTGRVVREEIYDRYIPGDRRRVREAEMGEILLKPIERDQAARTLRIDEEWEETLALLMSKRSKEALEESAEDIRRGRIRQYVPFSA